MLVWGGANYLGYLVSMSWTPPGSPGAASVVYDTIRSTSAADFDGVAAS